MCLAIYKPANQVVPTDHLEEGFISNPHGAGFAYVIEGRIETRKGFFTFKEFLAAYEESVTKETPALIHFRFATHGKRNEFNCHPWDVCGGEYVAIHNGILDIQSTEEMSDTGHFMDLVLTPALECFADPAHPAIKYLVEQAIGSGNKIVLMGISGEAVIYNEDAGTWDEGVWYSNCGYKSYRSSYSGRFLPDSYYNGYGHSAYGQSNYGSTASTSSSRRKARKAGKKMKHEAFNAQTEEWKRTSFTSYNSLGDDDCASCGNVIPADELVIIYDTWGSCCQSCAQDIEDMEEADAACDNLVVPEGWDS